MTMYMQHSCVAQLKPKYNVVKIMLVAQLAKVCILSIRCFAVPTAAAATQADPEPCAIASAPTPEIHTWEWTDSR